MCGVQDTDGIQKRIDNLERLTLMIFHQVNPAASMSSFQQAESMAAVAAEAEQEQPEAVDDENAIEVISVDQDDASEIKIEVQE